MAGKLKYSAYVYRFKIIYFYFAGVSRMSQRVVGKIPGAGAPPKCRPPSFLVMDEVKQREPKSCFNLAENFNPTSLWVGSHRYTRIFQLSKPLWANNAHKVEPNTRPIKNNSKSLLILKSPKTNLKLPSLIAKSSPIFSILQYCRAIGGCYWT